MTLSRKPRVLIFDDNASVLNVLQRSFSLAGYEVFSYAEPRACPVYNDSAVACERLKPCADLIITDFSMPVMNGAELLEHQSRAGCRLDIRNKAILSGFIPDEDLARVKKLGCAVFQKPLRLSDFSPWLKECEKRFDLAKPLGIVRRESRYATREEVVCCCADTNEILRGTVVNISGSGLCIKVQDPLPGCRTLVIKSDLSNCCESADVRWVREDEGNEFLVGVTCG